MKLIKQANRWSCLLTSFAMALDDDPENIIQYIGHNGSQILWPGLPEPALRRSFHIQEMVDYCYTKNMAVIPIETFPSLSPNQKKQFQSIKNRLKIAIQLQRIKLSELNELYQDLENLGQGAFLIGNPKYEDHEARLYSYMDKNIGVLYGETLEGKPHAVAWDGEKIYDPCGKIRGKADFITYIFYLIKSFCAKPEISENDLTKAK